MSNKVWDQISYAQSETADKEVKLRDSEEFDNILDKAYKIEQIFIKSEMQDKCSGYGIRCDVDCDAWGCPYNNS